ncbi:RHS repeat-associated core domain-containing protein [Curtobacterium sp. RRHDQ10]|uniref:RHS repeat-associated core domain-containing protein n=1 Tax=Curtobacterium phyllosphaerae TaxID=3413379 RepID=UPI003BF01BD5
MSVTDGTVDGADKGGVVTTTSNLLGQTTSYVDVWGTTTATTYDLAGRVDEVMATPPSGPVHRTKFEYNVDSQVEIVSADGNVIADPSYTAGELTGVTYPSGAGNAGNGTALSQIVKNAAGAVTSVGWSFPNGQLTVSDTVVRSQSGDVLQDTTTDGTVSNVSTYSYDTAGRLVAATIPRHQLAYGFGPAACTQTGAVAAAGKNGNRTSSSDQLTDTAGAAVAGSPASTVASCYDAADRLIGTTVTNPVTGASPVNQSLSSGQIVYDEHGNTVKLADEALTYDGGDRHTKTVLDDGSKVTYVRDTTDRIVQRTETTPGGQVTVTRYGFTGDGDTPDFALDGSSALTEWDLSLPGGVTAELRGTSSSWSYPNIHGDIITTADGAGTRASGLAVYDPFGQVEDPTSGLLGTVTANQAGPDTQTGAADYGWLGQHQKLSEHLGSIATIEMGARQYVAALGRFLQVDPVEGGTDNDYAYVKDPTDAFDLTGRCEDGPECIGEELQAGGGKWTTTLKGPGPKGGESSAAAYGRAMHKIWKYPKGFLRESYNPQLRMRFDAINYSKRIIIELKPNTARGIRTGNRQLRKYVKYMEWATGQKWHGKLVTYNVPKRPVNPRVF